MRLRDRVALVTGGGTGIGRAIAERFVAEGARVAVTGRRKEPLEALVGDLGANRVLAVPADVSIAEDRERLLVSVHERFGPLDILVSSAGAVVSQPQVETSDDTWRRLFETNVLAPVALACGAMPMLRERKGCILNVSTGASLKPVPGFSAYGATKAAINHASRVLALEAAPAVRVNVICPGGVDTPIFGTFLDREGTSNAIRWFDETTPLGRIGQPDDIASAALWLCSDEASWVTGTVLVVDGGLNLA